MRDTPVCHRSAAGRLAASAQAMSHIYLAGWVSHETRQQNLNCSLKHREWFPCSRLTSAACDVRCLEPRRVAGSLCGWVPSWLPGNGRLTISWDRGMHRASHTAAADDNGPYQFGCPGVANTPAEELKLLIETWRLVSVLTFVEGRQRCPLLTSTGSGSLFERMASGGRRAVAAHCVPE